jgi:hypothetical protein
MQTQVAQPQNPTYETMKRPLFEIVKSPNVPEAEDVGMPKSIFQIKVTLRYSDPKIWRRILIPSDMLLSNLHEVLQIVMGWQDNHLHQFIQNKLFYGPEWEDEEVTWGWQSSKVEYSRVKISDLLQSSKSKLDYEYDFGDSWIHHLTLEKIIPWSELQKLPICLEGELRCPPEDCGGIFGYYDLLEVLKNPQHEDYEDLKEWVGEDFDPLHFDVDEVNEQL